MKTLHTEGFFKDAVIQQLIMGTPAEGGRTEDPHVDDLARPRLPGRGRLSHRRVHPPGVVGIKGSRPVHLGSFREPSRTGSARADQSSILAAPVGRFPLGVHSHLSNFLESSLISISDK